VKYFKILYNSFLWSMALALTCFRNEWLEMRVNIGYLLFGIWLILFAAGCVLFRKQAALRRGFRFSSVNLLICALYGFLLYGAGRMAVVPAAIVREGLHVTGISFTMVNTVLAVLLAAGPVLLYGADRPEAAGQR
jgi:hypothetical protein